MTNMRPEFSSDKKLRRRGAAGMAIGLLALIACELPIILAIVGLGGLSAGAMAFRPPPIVELLAIILFVVGAGTLLFQLAKRVFKPRKARNK